jgi:hypothetical protein
MACDGTREARIINIVDFFDLEETLLQHHCIADGTPARCYLAPSSWPNEQLIVLKPGADIFSIPFNGFFASYDVAPASSSDTFRPEVIACVLGHYACRHCLISS